MPKKRRGRPSKLELAKCPSMHSRNAKNKDLRCEEADYDVNQRRESYKNFLLNNEPKVPTIFSGPKQLHMGTGGLSYRESLMNFTKDLGPTAQKVARQMLERQRLINPTQHQLEPLFQSPDAIPHPHVLDVKCINGSLKNTIPNQLTQPLISFGDSKTDTIANYKGKKIMVDDGKSNSNKWDDVGVNFDFLFGKQKGGVKIGNSSLDNQDIGNKNLDQTQVGNQRTTNHFGLFSSSYNKNLNQNINNTSVIQDNNSGQKEVLTWNASNQKLISNFYPSTYLSRPRNVSSSYHGFDNEVSPFSWVPQPPMHNPTAVAPPSTTFNSVANDNFWNGNELQLALALNMQVKDQEPNVWSRNLGGSNQANQFLQVHPQDRLMVPMQPHFGSQMVMSRAKPEQNPLPFHTQQDSGFQMGNHMQHPPPGF